MVETELHLSAGELQPEKSESEVTQSCPTLGDPMDCSSPGSSVRGISRAKILESVAFPSPGDLPNPGIKQGSSALQADSLWSEPPGKPLHVAAAAAAAKSLQSCPTPRHPIDRSLPGSSIHGILQARIVEWVAMLASWGSSPPRD